MSIENPRPGSMLAAEVKQNKIFRWILTGIFVVLISMVHFNFLETNLYKWKLRTDAGGIIGSWVAFGIGLLFVWFHQWFEDKFIGEKNGWVYPVVLLLSIALGIASAAGFNFSLAGIEPGVTN